MRKESIYLSQIKFGLLVLVIITLIMIISGQVKAQKTKTSKVVSTQTITINQMIVYDESNIIIDTVYHMLGRDARYTALVEYITVKTGSKYDVISLLNKCLESFNEDPGTSFDFNGSSIHVEQMMGVNVLYVYGEGSDNRGFISLTKSLTKRLITKLSE